VASRIRDRWPQGSGIGGYNDQGSVATRIRDRWPQGSGIGGYKDQGSVATRIRDRWLQGSGIGGHLTLGCLGEFERRSVACEGEQCGKEELFWGENVRKSGPELPTDTVEERVRGWSTGQGQSSQGKG
jgi:hypothetical protein